MSSTDSGLKASSSTSGSEESLGKEATPMSASLAALSRALMNLMASRAFVSCRDPVAKQMVDCIGTTLDFLCESVEVISSSYLLSHYMFLLG